MNWTQAFWAFIALVVLRITILPDFWVALGLVALVYFWNWLRGQFSGMQPLINWGLGLLVAIAVIGTVGLNLYNSYIAPNTPMTRAASGRALIATDLETAIKTNPHVLKSRLEVVSHLQWIEDRVGERHASQLATIRQNFETGAISQDEALAKSRLVAQEAQSLGVKTQENLSLLTVKPADSSPTSSWPWRLVFFGVIMLAVLLIPEKFIRIPGKKFIGLVGVILLFCGLAFVIFPEIQPSYEVTSRQSKKIISKKPSQLVPTGITLQLGDKIVGSKNSDAPPVELVLRFSDGASTRIDQRYWKDQKIELLHVGHNGKGRPAEIFYRGEVGRYNFEKISPASAPRATLTPAAYSPSSDKQPLPARQQAPKEKNDCPFN